MKNPYVFDEKYEKKCAEVEVDDWMEEENVVLKKHAYKALINLVVRAREDAFYNGLTANG